jgi:hypothetical protein
MSHDPDEEGYYDEGYYVEQWGASLAIEAYWWILVIGVGIALLLLWK